MFSLSKISTWPTSRWPWYVIVETALLLEFIALYFQYGMGLEPCIMCVYQRVAVLGIALSALPALLMPHNIFARLSSSIGVLIASIWGLDIALEHVAMQNPDNFLLALSCDIYPNFPNWLQLHTMFPAIFEARGTCGDIDWSFAGLSMPQWMIVVFGTYTAAISSVLLIRLYKLKSI